MHSKRQPATWSGSLLLISLILIIVTGANYLAYRHGRQIVLAGIEARLQRQLTHHATMVEESIAERVKSASSWAQQPVMARVLDEDKDHEIAELLDTLVHQDPSLRELSCINRKGVVLASTNPSMLGKSVASVESLTMKFENGLRYSIVNEGQELIFHAPLLVEFDRLEVIGVLRMVIPAAELLPIEPVFWAGLVTGSGDILVEQGVRLGRRWPLEAAAEDPSKSDSVVTQSLLIALPPGGEGPECFLAMAERYDTLFAPLRVLRSMFVWTTAGSSLVIILLITSFARRRQLLLLRLEESAIRTRSILDSALDVIISMDEGGVITTWNPQAEKVFGWTADEAVGRKLAETIIPERYRDKHCAKLSRFLQTGEGSLLNKRVELSALHRDGREFPIELSLSAVSSGGGYTFNGFLRDITERLQQEQELRKLSRVIEQTSVSVMITDMEERIEFVNRAFVDITGYTPEEVVGKNPRLLKSGLTPMQANDEMWNELLAGRDWRGELHIRRKNGEQYWTLAVISPLQDAQGKTTHYVAVYENITARKQMEEDLRSAARTDKLTGLPNRALLLDRLQHAMERAKRLPEYHFAVMFLDFDRFKIVNDSLGHEIGDMLLRAIAARLRVSLRTGDSMSRDTEGTSVGRLGGDEFVILLDCIKKPEDAAKVADRLLKDLAAPYQLGEHEVHSTASIGIVCSNSDYDKADDILRDADTAMYEAKTRGRACFIMFDASMQTAVQNRLQIENDLRAAIDGGCSKPFETERDDQVRLKSCPQSSPPPPPQEVGHPSRTNAGDAIVGTDQFFLVYQPIVSLEDRKLCGVEVLVRWNHPARGLVSPDEFIPIAEETRLILPLTNWIVEQACAQFMKWRRQAQDRAPGYISVNLSRIHLAEQDLVEQIVRIVQRAGMEPGELQLEMTESGILRDRKAAKKVLHALKAAGIRLAMDDFGTGQSSLSCLHELPFDALKIDQSFVINLERGRQFIAMARTVVALAENLGMICVAEGVENRAQVAALQSMGCACAQGYYFGKPMSGEALIDGMWMDGHRSTEKETSRLMV